MRLVIFRQVMVGVFTYGATIPPYRCCELWSVWSNYMMTKTGCDALSLEICNETSVWD